MRIKLTHTQVLGTIDTFSSQFSRDIQDEIKQLRDRQKEIDNIVNTEDELKFPFDSYNDLITEWDTAAELLHNIVIIHCTTDQLQEITAKSTYA
jgi:hypothetical protein